jgi:hypothetical protein
LNLNAKFSTFRPQLVEKLWAIFEMQFKLLQNNLTLFDPFLGYFKFAVMENKTLKKYFLKFSLSQK